MTPNPQDSAVALEVERAAFEAWYCADAERQGHPMPNGIANLREENHYGGHRTMLNGKWEGWQALASQSNGTSGGWISVDERLPELGASVALLKADGWENTGSDLEMNIRACGYLADAGPFKHWSIRGERATELKYFTHWMVLPAAPNQGENHVG